MMTARRKVVVLCACLATFVVSVLAVEEPAAVPTLSPAQGQSDPPGASSAAPPATDGRTLTVVTSASSGFFTRLQNLVGSLHFWAPGTPVVVYDLGLDEPQRAEVRGWLGVELRRFDFSRRPGHLRNLRNYAWKPVVMLDAMSRPGFGGLMLYQDAGQEIRSPLAEIEAMLRRDGYFFVVQEGLKTKAKCCGTIGELCHTGTSDYLGIDRSSFEDAVMCAGGIQGYALNSSAYYNVLLPTVACALVADCIAPTGATTQNHRFDQAVFSIYIKQNGLQCQYDYRFWANQFNTPVPGGVPRDEKAKSDIILFTRRGIGYQGNGGPYVQHIQKTPQHQEL
ncbi:hypothetical protein Pelo_333 [Pelomyxa schiedti]|nr:hypothetical protein Pelo_333 [Pelomyxa schiedti]